MLIRIFPFSIGPQVPKDGPPCNLPWSICLYLLGLLRRSLLYMVVLDLICWPIWVVGVDRNWVLSVEISVLMDLRDWSYHLRADFCFLVGGPLLRNLTACFVSSKTKWEKPSTMESILGFSAVSLLDRIWSFRVKWEEVSCVSRRCVASGNQSNLSRGKFVACVGLPSIFFGWRFTSVTMRE